MSNIASQLINRKFLNIPSLTEKGQKEALKNFEQWKERYQGALDSNLKLIQRCRLPMVPENIRKEWVQTALKNIDRIMQEATLDLANSQMKIYGNPDNWATVDPTVSLEALKATIPKS